MSINTPVVKKQKLDVIKSPAKSNEERLSFLRVKKVFGKNSVIQDIEFRFICNPDEAPLESQDDYRLAQQRLDRILSKSGDKLILKGQHLPDDVQTFSEFLELNPDWRLRESSFIFHLDHSKVKGKDDVFVQRAQLSGLYYIHGPDILQHYLQQNNRLE